ncbi:hypothetical protein K443DRAFT_683996 [Laccaria amethystina LaAM-08-1]|uniref:DNA-directed RNA polymerase III subunit RPC6 n=1 Tax=Laccaria amethystina LaAM-08-1 TaxID=1095629 RepID=A0A0C9XD70_9AGAR|nr:hypothetical protein K443DRAFT_683996 [Laccaria amethystina LaAM-08-1]
MSKRPPNELESRLHQAALSSSKKEITAKQAESIIPDPSARQDALNFLLGVGLFKSLKDPKGNLLFRAVTKNELVATKDLTGEENLVLSHIKIAANEGIWTKHLKAKTNLHQTVIDRCLKTLVQKRLIKRVPSVQHPTRKIYMLEGLEPSIALTGGPWYTDNELDTEFIQNLTEACYKFISDLSFPKRKEGAPGALYPISNAPQYPTAQHIRNSLRKARLTETDLTVEHVEMLLNVLVLDGKIEKLPAFGSALWDSSAIGEDSDDDGDRKSQKKRKRHSDDEDDKRKKRKRKKHAISSDDESASDSGSRKKHRRKRAKDNSDSDDSESDEEGKKKKKKKKKKRRDIAPSSSDDGSSDSDDHKKKKKKKKVKQESSESDDEEPDLPRKRKSSKRSSSPAAAFDEYDTNSGGTVYRAIKAETIFLGWSESPCALCPSFDFCKDGGPVNPRECVYYGDWLTGGTVAVVEDML